MAAKLQEVEAMLRAYDMAHDALVGHADDGVSQGKVNEKAILGGGGRIGVGVGDQPAVELDVLRAQAQDVLEGRPAREVLSVGTLAALEALRKASVSRPTASRQASGRAVGAQ